MHTLEQEFQTHADLPYAKWQENYMRNHFPFIGVRQPIRKKIQKPFISSATKQDISTLWNKREREFQYVAIDILSHLPLEQDDLPLIEWLITHKSWWDTVDVLASKIAGSFFKQFPDLIPHTNTWTSNLWLKRSQLIFQLRYKDKTNAPLLFSYCSHHAQDPSPWIQRAIAWALREYSKTNREEVIQFLQTQTFSKLVLREAIFKKNDVK